MNELGSFNAKLDLTQCNKNHPIIYLQSGFDNFTNNPKVKSEIKVGEDEIYYPISVNGGKPVNEEIFNGTKTKYKLIEVDGGYLITFFTNSHMEYRFDLFREPNTNIYHLGFSISNTHQSDYEKVTDANESIELFSRLTWILKDLKLEVDEFCIGATGNPKKDRIYEYMMRFVDSWQKRKNDHYPLGWALYII